MTEIFKATILAIDAATKTGWCLWSNGKIVESGTEDFSKQRGESNGMMFLRFRIWLTRMLLRNITLVIYEMAHHRGGAATEICVNLTGRVQEMCSELKIEYTAVHTATLKKWATGDGRADKGEMMVQAGNILGRKPIDSNEADTVMMAAFASNMYGEKI